MRKWFQNIDNRWVCVFYIGSFFVLAFLYGKTLGFGYIWDDNELFVYNPSLVNASSLNWHLIARPVLVDTSYFRPLVFLSWFLEFQWFGLYPAISHFINISVFYLTVLLLFHLLRHVFKGRKYVNEVSALSALIYLCHPMNVEAVAWVAGRFDVFATFFLLLAFYGFLAMPNNIIRISWVAIAYVGALGSKEIGILFLPAVFCFWVLSRHADDEPWSVVFKSFFQQNIVLLSVVFILTIAYLFVRNYYANGMNHIALTWDYVRNYYIENQIPVVSLKEYILRTILPFYDLGVFLPIEYFAQLPNKIISWIVFVLLVCVSVWSIHNRKTIIFAVFGYIIMISLVIYIVPITIANNVVQDRFLLSALPFYTVLLAYAMFYLTEYRSKIYTAAISGLLYILFISLVTLQLVPIWHDEMKFWYNVSYYQEKYNHEPHVMYLRSLMAYDAPREMVEDFISKERASIKETGAFRPLVFILYGQYLVNKRDPKGLDYLKEYKDLISELGDKYRADGFSKSQVYAIYYSYALGLLTMEKNIEEASRIYEAGRKYMPYENAENLSLDVMLKLLQNKNIEAKELFNELIKMKNLDREGFIKNMNSIIRDNCKANNLDIPVCLPNFDIRQLENK